MPLGGFEPATTVIKRPQTYALDSMTIGIGGPRNRVTDYILTQVKTLIFYVAFSTHLHSRLMGFSEQISTPS